MTPFKICCMLTPAEIDMAVAAGARAVGLVADMPNGPGILSDDKVKTLADHVRAAHGDAVWSVLLTSRIDPGEIADHIASTGVNTVQIVDHDGMAAIPEIRAAHPTVRVLQVVHVEDESAIDIASAAAGAADFILLDSGKPSSAVKTFGGTGDTHDWTISRQIVEAVEKPVFLAGGLGPDNIRAAMAAVRPYGVDICSGLRDRDNGYVLLGERLSAFAAALAAPAG